MNDLSFTLLGQICYGYPEGSTTNYMLNQNLTPLGAPVRFEIDPVPKPRQTRSDKWKQRPIVMRYRAFADTLRAQIRGKLEPQIALTFYVSMPLSWTKTKRAQMNGQPHQARPDIDNLIKSVLDALCPNDEYIFNVHAQKFWAESGAIEIQEFTSL